MTSPCGARLGSQLPAVIPYVRRRPKHLCAPGCHDVSLVVLWRGNRDADRVEGSDHSTFVLLRLTLSTLPLLNVTITSYSFRDVESGSGMMPNNLRCSAPRTRM